MYFIEYSFQATEKEKQFHTTFGKVCNFINELIFKLRMFKNGEIECEVMFIFEKESKFISGMLSQPIIGNYSERLYEIKDDEIEALFYQLNTKITHNKLTELALNNFEQSYLVSNEKLKFVLLTVSLESILNVSKDQITHTIARHASLIISQDANEFRNNYKRIKELYDYRSAIVHGKKPKTFKHFN